MVRFVVGRDNIKCLLVLMGSLSVTSATTTASAPSNVQERETETVNRIPTDASVVDSLKITELFPDERSFEERRREMYRYHGIFPPEESNGTGTTNGSTRVERAKSSSSSSSSISSHLRQRRRLRRQQTKEARKINTLGRRRAATETDSNNDKNVLSDAIVSIQSHSLRQSVVGAPVAEERNIAVRLQEQNLQLPGKKGIAFALREEGEKDSWVENVPKIIYVKPYWHYNWSPFRKVDLPDDIEWVPMVWTAWDEDGARKILEEEILPNVEAGYAKRLLGFNEPDRPEQADMTVEKAANLWPILESAGIPLASPAVAHDGSDWSKDWISVSAERSFRQDYIAVHWYGWPSANAFKEQMRYLYELYGGNTPLLISEFAPADWEATSVEENRFNRTQVLQFMKIVLPWMEDPEQDWIAGYAWFPFDPSWPPGHCSALFEEDGSATALGRYYASIRTETPYGDTSIEVV